MTMKSAKDKTAYLTLPLIDCRPRHAKDTDTHSAKIIIAATWLRWMPDPNIQDFRPHAIRYASITPNKFTTPAAAMNRVP